ncbi:MAG: TlpA family protein disulfide reductase, partial [Alphaproteobacteria bacterium]|nr:TlpA family protein disulfide reductase [Alphaproteobacteria bacterium]
RAAYLPQVQEWSVEKLGVEIAGSAPKTAVLVFYTTWCPHCKAMFPDLLELYKESDSAKVAFYFVVFDREPEIIANFLAHHEAPKEVTFWRMPEAENETLKRWAEAQKLAFKGGVPYVAVYGRDGKMFQDFYGRVKKGTIQEALKLAQARDVP